MRSVTDVDYPVLKRKATFSIPHSNARAHRTHVEVDPIRMPVRTAANVDKQGGHGTNPFSTQTPSHLYDLYSRSCEAAF